MSYDVRLHPMMGGDEVCQVPHHEGEGGTYVVGGSEDARLNITFNYAEVYHLVGFSIRDLDGCIAEEALPKLEEVFAKLGNRQYRKDYWAPTPGNAGHALEILIGWCKLHPKAVFEVDA